MQSWQQSNARVIASLNRLSEAAEGMYLTTLDLQDLWLRTRLAMGMQNISGPAK